MKQGLLRILERNHLGFWCPGCKEMHIVSVDAGGWAFNQNYDYPTFHPSILVKSGHYSSAHKEGKDCWCTFDQKYPDQAPTKFKCFICHSFVVDGKIQFLPDCSHEFAGQTIPLTAVMDENV